MRRHGGTLAVVLTASVGLVGCGDSTEVAEGVAATPRAIAAITDEVISLDARRFRGEFADYGYPESLSAEVDFGVDPEGTESGETLSVYVGLGRLSELSRQDRDRLSCDEPPMDGGCREEVIDGSTLLFTWQNGTPESDPGYAAYTFVRGDDVINASVSGPFIKRDPARQDLGLSLDELRAVATDPRITFEMDDETLSAGAALDDYTGDERPPDPPAREATPPEMLAAQVVRYAGVKPTSAGPSTLDDFGPDAVGATLMFPPRKGFAEVEVDILTVAGRPAPMDPMPCGDTNDGTPLPAGAKCFGWSEDMVASWELAQGSEPGTLWIYGYQDDETYLREESVGLRIRSTDLTVDLFGDDFPLPEWVLAYLAPIVSDLSIGPETVDPSFKPVPGWRD